MHYYYYYLIHLVLSISSCDRANICRNIFGIALIFYVLILIISSHDLEMYYFKNIVMFFMDHLLMLFDIRKCYGAVILLTEGRL